MCSRQHKQEINFDYPKVAGSIQISSDAIRWYSKDDELYDLENKRNRLTQDGTLEGVEGRKHNHDN